MGKLVNKATAEKVGKTFLESLDPIDSIAVKKTFKERKFDLVHHAASLTMFAARVKTQTRAKLLTLKKDEDPCFYVFNSSEKEFVIVAADESAEPIIAYSTQGDFDETNMAPATAEYLENMRLAILHIRKNKIAASQKITTKWRELKSGNKDMVTKDADTYANPGGGGLGSGAATPNFATEPLIKTKWGQRGEAFWDESSKSWKPYLHYNSFCPPDCPTGCGATAMAQIMNFYGFPITGFSWDLMPQTLNGASTTAEIDAVATLMRQCGVSVDTRYAPSESSCKLENVQNALKSYFNNNAIAKYDEKEDGWWSFKLFTEILEERPVLYAGQGSGGHLWICDGWSPGDLFHFNWGWYGKNDGYFTITGLYPGEAPDNHDYNTNNKFLYNINPNVAICFINASVSHPTNNNNELNPIIFPYGKVPVAAGHSRTFVINKNNIGDEYMFSHVTVNGEVKNTKRCTAVRSNPDNKVEITVSATSYTSLIVHLRYKQLIEVDYTYYRPLSPHYTTVEVAYQLSNFPVVYYKEIPSVIRDVAQTTYSVVGIGENAFYNYTYLRSIRTTVQYIDKSAFSGCVNLSLVEHSVSDLKIYDDAFYGCTNLQTFNSMSKVTYVGNRAFYNCSKLESVILHNMSSIGTQAFYGCKKLTKLTFPVAFSANIRDRAFEQCTGINNILSFPANPPSCGANTFLGIDKNIPVYVPANSISAYRNATGWNYFTNYQPITAVIGNVNYTILDAHKAIATGPNNTNTPSITLLDSIRYGDLYGVNDKEYYVESIAPKAFYNATFLRNITLMVSKIDDYTFEGCTNIANITCYSEPPTLEGKDVFKGVMPLNNIVLHVYARYVDAYSTADVWQDFTIIPMFEKIKKEEYYVLIDLMMRLQSPIIDDLRGIFERREIIRILDGQPNTVFTAQDIYVMVTRLNEMVDILPAGEDNNAVRKALLDIQKKIGAVKANKKERAIRTIK